MDDEFLAYPDYDEACELFVHIPREYSYRKYVARICGPDPKYGLKRKFLRYEELEPHYSFIIYNYGALEDGIYETSVRYYTSSDQKNPVHTSRSYLILYDDDYVTIEFKDLPKWKVLSYLADIENHRFVMSEI